jgi:hypothetical protein
LDDVDRLFARLEPIEPPPDLVERVAHATGPGRGVARGRRAVWLALDAAAIALLAVVSLSLGIELQESGARDLLELVVVDASALPAGLGVLLEALLESLPWLQLALLVANLIAVVALSQLALSGDRRAGRVRA